MTRKSKGKEKGGEKEDLGDGVFALFRTYFDCLVEKQASGIPFQPDDLDLVEIFLCGVASKVTERRNGHAISSLTKAKEREREKERERVSVDNDISPECENDDQKKNENVLSANESESITISDANVHSGGVVLLQSHNLSSFPPLLLSPSLSKSITQLNLDCNNLERLPDNIHLLERLAGISLARNSLSWLPSSIKMLTNLKVIRLSHNRFRSFPVVLVGMKGLVEVNLEGNMIEGLPPCLFWMNELRRLVLNGNYLTSLPESMGWLPNLRKLSLHDNLIESLPNNLSRLPLTSLTISNNPLPPSLLSLPLSTLLETISSLPSSPVPPPPPYRLVRTLPKYQSAPPPRPTKQDMQTVLCIQNHDTVALGKQAAKSSLRPHALISPHPSLPGIKKGDTALRFAHRCGDPKVLSFFYGELEFPIPGWLWADAFHMLAEETGSYFFSSDFRFMVGVLNGVVDYYNYANPFQTPDRNAEFYSSLAKSLLHFLRGPGVLSCVVLPDAYKYVKGFCLSEMIGEGAIATGGATGETAVDVVECFCCFHLSHPGSPPPCPVFLEEGNEEHSPAPNRVPGFVQEEKQKKKDKEREAGKSRFGLVKSLKSLSGWERKGGEEDERGRNKRRERGVTIGITDKGEGGGREDQATKKGRSNSFGQVPVAKPANNNIDIITTSDDGVGGSFAYSCGQGSVSSYFLESGAINDSRGCNSTPNGGDIRKRSHTTTATPREETSVSIRKNGSESESAIYKTKSSSSASMNLSFEHQDSSLPCDVVSTNPFPLSLTRGFDWEMEKEREEREKEEKDDTIVSAVFLDTGAFGIRTLPKVYFPCTSSPPDRIPKFHEKPGSQSHGTLPGYGASPSLSRARGGDDISLPPTQSLSFAKRKPKKKKRPRRSPEYKRDKLHAKGLILEQKLSNSPPSHPSSLPASTSTPAPPALFPSSPFNPASSVLQTPLPESAEGTDIFTPLSPLSPTPTAPLSSPNSPALHFPSPPPACPKPIPLSGYSLSPPALPPSTSSPSSPVQSLGSVSLFRSPSLSPVPFEEKEKRRSITPSNLTRGLKKTKTIHHSMEGEEDTIIGVGEKGNEPKRIPKSKKDRKNWKKRVSHGGKHNSGIASSPPFRTKGEEDEKGGGLTDLLVGKQKSSLQQISPSFSRWSTHHHHPTATDEIKTSGDVLDPSPSTEKRERGGEGEGDEELVDMLVNDVFKHLSFDPKTVVSSPRGEALRRVCFACLSDRKGNLDLGVGGGKRWGGGVPRPVSFNSSLGPSTFSASGSGSSGLPLPSPPSSSVISVGGFNPPGSSMSTSTLPTTPTPALSPASTAPSPTSSSNISILPIPNAPTTSSNPPTSSFSSSFSPVSTFSWNASNYPPFAASPPEVSTFERELELEKERQREKRELPSKRLFSRENSSQYQAIFEKPIPLISRALALSVDSTGFSFHDVQAIIDQFCTSTGLTCLQALRLYTPTPSQEITHGIVKPPIEIKPVKPPGRSPLAQKEKTKKKKERREKKENEGKREREEKKEFAYQEEVGAEDNWKEGEKAILEAYGMDTAGLPDDPMETQGKGQEERREENQAERSQENREERQEKTREKKEKKEFAYEEVVGEGKWERGAEKDILEAYGMDTAGLLLSFPPPPSPSLPPPTPPSKLPRPSLSPPPFSLSQTPFCFSSSSSITSSTSTTTITSTLSSCSFTRSDSPPPSSPNLFSSSSPSSSGSPSPTSASPSSPDSPFSSYRLCSFGSLQDKWAKKDERKEGEEILNLNGDERRKEGSEREDDEDNNPAPVEFFFSTPGQESGSDDGEEGDNLASPSPTGDFFYSTPGVESGSDESIGEKSGEDRGEEGRTDLFYSVPGESEESEEQEQEQDQSGEEDDGEEDDEEDDVYDVDYEDLADYSFDEEEEEQEDEAQKQKQEQEQEEQEQQEEQRQDEKRQVRVHVHVQEQVQEQVRAQSLEKAQENVNEEQGREQEQENKELDQDQDRKQDEDQDQEEHNESQDDSESNNSESDIHYESYSDSDASEVERYFGTWNSHFQSILDSLHESFSPSFSSLPPTHRPAKFPSASASLIPSPSAASTPSSPHHSAPPPSPNFASPQLSPSSTSFPSAFSPRSPSFSFPLTSSFTCSLSKSGRAVKGGEKTVELSADLVSLSRDFIQTAKTYGKIIILERYSKLKTIQAVSMGGSAGGLKYLVNDVMFKFASDANELFATNDIASGKVAAHDLKGLMGYVSCGLDEVRVPLMAIVDYLGFRLTAMSVLPVGRDTLVYGTMDAGKTIRNDSERLCGLMQKTAEIMNLRPHVCGNTTLFSAADVEGHIGRDGRMYLLDFSRTFPCTTPDPRFHMGHLYQLFRPEFVCRYPVPLCPDAFSGFTRNDPKRKEFNEHVVEATKELKTKVLSQLVTYLGNEVPGAALENFSVSRAFHKFGVNLRFIGLALQRSTITRTVYIVLFIEAISRALKNELNKRLRAKASELQVKGAYIVPLRNMAIEFLNLVFGNGAEALTFWQECVLPALKLYFNVDCNPNEDLRTLLLKEVSSNGYLARYLLFVRLQDLTGIRFEDSESFARKLNSKDSTIYFHPMQLQSFRTRVKHTTTVTNAEGNFALGRALEELKEGELEDARQHFLKAKMSFEKTLESSPREKMAINKLMRIDWRLLEIDLLLRKKRKPLCYPDAHAVDKLSAMPFSMTETEVLELEPQFHRALGATQRRDPFIEFLYAVFLLQGGQWVRAHGMLLELCEKFPFELDFQLTLALLLVTTEKKYATKLLARVRLILQLKKLIGDEEE